MSRIHPPRQPPASLRVSADDAPILAVAIARYGNRSAALRAALHAWHRAEDAATERAAIVACLREGTGEDTDTERALLGAFADMFERGEHRARGGK